MNENQLNILKMKAIVTFLNENPILHFENETDFYVKKSWVKKHGKSANNNKLWQPTNLSHIAQEKNWRQKILTKWEINKKERKKERRLWCNATKKKKKNEIKKVFFSFVCVCVCVYGICQRSDLEYVEKSIGWMSVRRMMISKLA